MAADDPQSRVIALLLEVGGGGGQFVQFHFAISHGADLAERAGLIRRQCVLHAPELQPRVVTQRIGGRAPGDQGTERDACGRGADVP